MSNQDKDEYEVGIPLDDLSSTTQPLDADPGGTEEEELAEEAGEVGLPSLFDEDELAEVGLKAAPFDDGDEMLADDPEAAAETDAAKSDGDLESADEPSEAMAIEAESVGSFEDQGVAEPVGEDAGLAAEHRAYADLPDAALPPPPDGPLNDQPDSDKLLREIERLHDKLAVLEEEFAGKLKYDAHKDKIIDKLHQELQEYKEDIVKKHILSVVLDVVKVADDIRKWLAYFRSLDVSQRDPVKLFRYLEAIPSDLEDIFYWQGVKPFTSGDGTFNPARQRALKKIPTDDPAKDKAIAKSLRPGYEWEDKVIRQEMVAVYVYEVDSESVDTRDIDE